MSFNEPLTDEELKAIEARANAATPGPWAWEEPKPYPPERIELNKRRSSALCRVPTVCGGDLPCVIAEDGVPLYAVDMDNINATIIFTLPDGTFIAHARTDVPRLIAEVRRLKAALNVAMAILARFPTP